MSKVFVLTFVVSILLLGARITKIFASQTPDRSDVESPKRPTTRFSASDSSVLCSNKPLGNCCVGRCGDALTSHVTCACDRQCEFYGNCCADYRPECEININDDDATINAMISPLREDIPASFTILFSFGTDGTIKTMFNSQEQDLWSLTKANCKDLEIWEPFNNKCRHLYCSSEFVLVGFKCVKVYDNSSISQGTDVDVANLTDTQMLWQNSSRVAVTLYLQLDQHVSKNVLDRLNAWFLFQLAKTVDASYERFANFSLTFNDTASSHSPSPDAVSRLVDATATFILSEQSDDDGHVLTDKSTLSEPTIERIVASLSSGISLSHLYFHVDGITMHVIGIAESAAPPLGDANLTSTLLSWCDTVNGDRTLLYENNDYEVIVRSDENSTSNRNVAMDIHILATDLIYHPGEYLASIVFQGNQMQKTANLSGYVVICDRSSDNNDCTRTAVPSTDYELLPNSSLLYLGSENLPSIINVHDYELLSDGTALVCYYVPPFDGTTVSNDKAAAFGAEAFGERLLNVILTAVSLLATLLTFVTYAAFSDLRSLTSGIYVMNLTACLWFFQLVFLIGERQSVVEFHPFLCRMIATFVHFTALCYFCWMNVVAIDLHRVFASSTSLLKSAGRSRKSIVWQLLYAYGCPAVVVCSCVLADLMSPKLGADYGTKGYCWIGNRTVQVLAFMLPVFLLLMSNVVLYVLVAISIRRIQLVTKLATTDHHEQKHSVSTAVIFVRLCTILGFTWLLGMFVTIPFKSPFLVSVCRYAFIVLNASHGTAIFVAFVCNRRVLLKYLPVIKAGFKEFVVVERRPCPHHVTSVVRCNECFNVSRTRSNETCKSALSSTD